MRAHGPALERPGVCSTKEMAGRLGVSEAHLSKVIAAPCKVRARDLGSRQERRVRQSEVWTLLSSRCTR